MNTLTNYMKLANRTNKEGSLINPKPEVINAYVSILPDIIKAAYAADRVKAAFVYDDKLRDTGFLPKSSISTDLSPLDKERIHAILGLVSEAGEICESIYNSIINNEPLDRDGLILEAGDLLWFLVLFLRSIDFTLDEAAHLNIKKLQVRYPDKFTEELALNRNLQGENNVVKED